MKVFLFFLKNFKYKQHGTVCCGYNIFTANPDCRGAGGVAEGTQVSGARTPESGE